MNILLISDNKMRNIFIRKLLEKKEHQVAVEEEFTGIEAVKKSMPQVIIISSSPGLNALDVCVNLRKDDETMSIPVILLSQDFTQEKDLADIKPVFQLKSSFKEYELTDLLERITKGKKKILLVDDSKLTHQRIGSNLTANGFEVIDAYDGQEALETALKEKPDLIITDIEMPNKDGYEFCREVKANPDIQHIPVLIVSALNKGINVEKGFEVGANDYLTKPVIIEELISQIHSTFEGLEIKGREKILVVDDSPTVLHFIKQGLVQQGFQVLTAGDGEQGYEKALKEKPALVISDMVMPKVSGQELVEYLKENPETKDIPIIIVSDRDSRVEKFKILKQGVVAFLSKPFTADKLIVIVERALAERRLKREKEAMKRYISDAAMEAVNQTAHTENGNELRANERTMTIFFSDIVGFTNICEKLGPNSMVELLNEYFDLMSKILKENGAMIDKFIGDAILALYHSESDEERGCYKAVKAALEMMQALEEFNKGRETPINIRIGINTGEVILGDIGSRLHRRDYTVIGDDVNIAQRLESAAVPGSVLISESTYKSVQNEFEVKEPKQLMLKGKKNVVNAYQVTGFKGT